MDYRWIKNGAALATTRERKLALDIIEQGLDAIETRSIIRETVSVTDDTLKIENTTYNLKDFNSIRIIGFGKASSPAALALEEMLGKKIAGGVVIDTVQAESRFVTSFQGTHPRPSDQNVAAAQKIVELAKQTDEKDLVLVIVSGGGSALLCYPQSECDQGIRLYDEFLKTGGTIDELNTVRKHLSQLKGGGLAQLLYPATVIGLILSDIPQNPQSVASGPTYPDKTTVTDAQNIVKKYNLENFPLSETPKDEKYFRKVKNFVIASSMRPLEKMGAYAQGLGLRVKNLSNALYDGPEAMIARFKKEGEGYDVVIGSGETTLVIPAEVDIPNKKGGGRNQYLALSALESLDDTQTFVSIDSDGIDNSDVAGGIADGYTKKKADEAGLSTAQYLKNYNSYEFFEKTGDGIKTGPTGANVSDLMILINGKKDTTA